MGKALATQTGDMRSLVLITSAYGPARGLTGAVREAIDSGVEAHRLAQQVDRPELKSMVGTNVTSLWLAGELERALRTAGRPPAPTALDPATRQRISCVKPYHLPPS